MVTECSSLLKGFITQYPAEHYVDLKLLSFHFDLFEFHNMFDSEFLSSVLVSLNLTLPNTWASLVPNFGLSSTFWKTLAYRWFMGRYWLDYDYASW
jgi:hypothetical protein